VFEDAVEKDLPPFEPMTKGERYIAFVFTPVMAFCICAAAYVLL
jgi:hypothetical protein